MDVICCMRCAGALLILLYVQASLVHAEPKSKAELGHRNAKLRVQTSVMMASNRRNNLRRKTGAQASPPVSSMSLAVGHISKLCLTHSVTGTVSSLRELQTSSRI